MKKIKYKPMKNMDFSELYHREYNKERVLNEKITVVFNGNDANFIIDHMIFGTPEPFINAATLLSWCFIPFSDKESLEKYGYTKQELLNAFKKRKLCPSGICGMNFKVTFPKPSELTWKFIEKAYDDYWKNNGCY